MYGYVLNDPVNKVDPSGKICMAATSIVQGARGLEILARAAYLEAKIRSMRAGVCDDVDAEIEEMQQEADDLEEQLSKYTPSSIINATIENCTTLDGSGGNQTHFNESI